MASGLDCAAPDCDKSGMNQDCCAPGNTCQSTPPESARSRWIRRAIVLSWLTIGYNLLEGLVSIYFGIEEESVALAGFGGDSLIEVASAVLVLWRFRGESGRAEGMSIDRERRATFGIGLLFLLLALITVAASASQLVSRAHPDTTVPGLVISALSLSFMFLLWSAKRKAGLALDSATVMKDAACSMACIQLSFVLFAGSLLYFVVPALWWADAAAALLIAGLIAREGWETVRSARSPDFSGGCGCA